MRIGICYNLKKSDKSYAEIVANFKTLLEDAQIEYFDLDKYISSLPLTKFAYSHDTNVSSK